MDSAQIKSLMSGKKRKSDRKKSDENKQEEESGRMQITRDKKGIEDGKGEKGYFSYTQLQFKPCKANGGKKSFTAQCGLERAGASPRVSSTGPGQRPRFALPQRKPRVSCLCLLLFLLGKAQSFLNRSEIPS